MQSLAQSDLHTQVVFTPVMVDVTFPYPPGVPPGGKWITTTEFGPSGMLKEIGCSNSARSSVRSIATPGRSFKVQAFEYPLGPRLRSAPVRVVPAVVGHGALERVDPG
jgi:hypothetical protein